MIVILHENNDEWPNVTPVIMFAMVLTKQILQVLSVVPNIYQKLDSVMCIFSNTST